MAGLNNIFVVVVPLTFLWTPSAADSGVFCVFNESCMVPCDFQVGDDILIHWYKVEPGNQKELNVHSYYYGQDQLAEQNQEFTGRTSLFKKEISEGNASLLLTAVRVQDEGRYKCYSSTKKESKTLFINLKVDAPIHKVTSDVYMGTAPVIVADPPEVSNQTSAVLRCNLTNWTQHIKGSHWTHNGEVIKESQSTATTPFTTYNLEKITHNSGGKYECVFLGEPEVKQTIEVKTLPHVSAYKHSVHGSENDNVILVCVSHSYPLLADWFWYKEEEDGSQKAILNGTDVKYEIKSTPGKTTLTVNDLSTENDTGNYICSGVNELGMTTDKIHLRVRSRLAALWPFLGIVAEVFILIIIIFIHEKRRKPNEVNDDDDSGSAPLKCNSSSNHKDKNVRKRNSN
ncbi:basigin-like isoform 1-T2 [Pholidichthys leucotaenia]